MGKELIIWSAIVIALLFVFVIVNSINKKKKRRQQDLEQIAREKLREEELDRLILNDQSQIDVLRATSEQPYYAVYSSSANTDISKQKNTKGKKLMLQLEETSLFSKRSYMLDPEKIISIGAGKDNTISLPTMAIDSRQCEISTYQADPEMAYVRNVGQSGKVMLIRKKESISVGSGFHQLIDGDMLNIADVRIRVTFVMTKQGENR